MLREKPTSPMPIRRKFNSIASDEEPLYDVVASDEDYSSIDNLSINSNKMKHGPQPEAVVEGPVSTEDFLQMKRKVGSLECQVHQLLQQNKDLKKERDELHLLVQKLTKEITILREHTQQNVQTLPNGYGKSEDVQNNPIRNPTRPQSMFEPRDQQRLSQKTMTSCVINCGVCTLRHISKPSVIWCSECDEGFCADCREHHGLSKGTRHHNTMIITEYRKLPPDILKISQFCSKHEDKYQTYCMKHGCPCCRRCVTESHNDCKDLRIIEDIVRDVKKSNAFLELEQRFAEMDENIHKIMKNRKENITSLKGQRTKIEEEINQARKKINEHLDRIQAELIDELASKEVDETDKIINLMTALKKKEKEIKECRATMTSIKQHASDLQAFLALKQLETDVDNKEEFLQLVTKGENLNLILLSCKIEALIQNFGISSLKFGEVSVESKPTKLTITRQKERQAQIFVPKISSTSIENITINLQQKINTYGYVRGCIILPDGRMMFSCGHENTVRCIDIEGRQDFKINLNTYPSDITYIEHDNTVAVSSGDYKCFYIIDIQSKRVNNVIEVDSYCDRITYKDGKIIFTAPDKGIRMLNLKDKSINDIITRKLYRFSYVTTFGDNIYFTDPPKHTVTCCDINGTMKWEFKEENVLKEPNGITVDNNGNVYVVGYISNNLVLISSDGKQCRELLNQKDGLFVPLSVHFQNDTNKLLVANFRETAFLYNE